MPTRLHKSGRGSSRVPGGAVQLYDDIEEIKARKGNQSYWPKQFFRHKFTRRGSKIYGLRNGNLLVTANRPLWDMFSYPESVSNNNRREENPMARRRRSGVKFNVWKGDSGGHRLAALMRWGHLRKGKIKRHRKRGRPKLKYRVKHRVKHRRVKHRVKHRRVGRPRKRVKHRKVVRRRTHRVRHRRRRSSGSLDHRTKAYKRMIAKQYRDAAGYGMYAKKVRRRLGKRRKGLGYSNNAPRRRYRMARHRRRHRKYGRNPFSMPSFGGYDLKKGIEPALLIGSSIMMSSVAVGYLQSRGWITLDAAWKRYGVQIGAGVAGAMILSKFAHKPEWAKYWGLGSLVAVAADLLATYVLPSINSALSPQVAATGAVAGFRGVNRGVGAFPPSNVRGIRGLGAFPTGGNAYNTSPYEKSTQYVTPY